MIPTLKLASGDAMPSIGMGLWKVAPGDCVRVVGDAIDVGYRHFDCACDYANEESVGQGLRAAIDGGLCAREDLWITSKLWNTYHARDHVRPACERSLRDLGVDYFDLYLIHFPIAQRYVPFETRYPPEWFYDPEAESPGIELSKTPIHETWSAMEELVRDGLVRNIGVCNFGTSQLRDLLAGAELAPSVLQVETHPYLTQAKLLRFCSEQGIAYTGFSPLGALSYFSLGMAEEGEAAIESEVIRTIAKRAERTPAQVILRWGLQRGTAIIPKSENRARMTENLAIFDFELTQAEMDSISDLNRDRRFNDPGDFCEAAFNTFCPIYE
jgi:D-xylose reductase